MFQAQGKFLAVTYTEVGNAEKMPGASSALGLFKKECISVPDTKRRPIGRLFYVCLLRGLFVIRESSLPVRLF